MHPLPERPQLQPYLTVARDPNDPRHVYLWDRLGLADGPQRFTFFEFVCLQLFDGKRTLREAQAEAMRQVGGELLPLETFVALVKKLDAARFLEGPRFLRYRLSYMLGQTLEETMAGPTLVYGGILDRFPRLKIIICHGGGGIPYQLGRFLNPPGREEAELYGSVYNGPFLDGFRKLYFDGTLYTTEALELLIKVVGPDRVLFGTETPGRGSFEYEGRKLDDLKPAVEGIEWLETTEKKMIFEDNAKKLFNLKVAETAAV